MKSLKKLLAISLSACLIMSFMSMTAFASNTAIGPLNGTYYKLKSITPDYKTVTKGGWHLIYTGAPATRDGEYDTISHEVSYSTTVSASLGYGIKDAVEAQLGVDIGASESFGISKNSAPLKKGEYVKAYYARTYSVSKVLVYVLYGSPTNDITSITPIRTRYVYRALQPQVKLEYYHHYSSSSINSLTANNENSKPYKTECYNYVNGKYILNETTFN